MSLKLQMHTKNPKKKNSSDNPHAIREITEGILAATFILLLGFIGASHAFADRITPHVRIGLFPVGGLLVDDVLQAMDAYEQEFLQTQITVHFRGGKSSHTLREFGMELDKRKTAEVIQKYAGKKISGRRIQVAPVIVFHDEIASKVLQGDFANHMTIPQNPTLALDAGGAVRIVPGKNGEGIDMVSLNRDVARALSFTSVPEVTALVVKETASLSPEDIEPTRIFTQNLIASGFQMTGGEETINIPGTAIASMAIFTNEKHLVMQLDVQKLREYLVQHIAPSIHEDPINARFTMEDGKVVQFALPKDGRTLDADGTIDAINKVLASGQQTAPLAVQIVRPLIVDTLDSKKLGIDTLLARGETDFVGSPKNRTANIGVGASRYDGILIAPNEEFSFNKFLGPVTKEAGYLPELVIKNNVTTAEYGGGLCQVSTTAFRAAMFSGMEITNRRNHSYAVRYYGTPGFDATIYPPYTDFRFLNNTPGYLLIQTKIEGTKLSFEFWGTSDNRVVEVDGPHPYDRKPDGSVKSVIKQKVMKDGQTLIDDTFYSNYKSPDLFPHA